MVNSCSGEVRSQSQSRMSHEAKAAVTKPAILHAARETIILYCVPRFPRYTSIYGYTWIDRGAALPLRVDLSCKRRNTILHFLFFLNLYHLFILTVLPHLSKFDYKLIDITILLREYVHWI